jgi:tetratricopeptide (TPR) repeat protein
MDDSWYERFEEYLQGEMGREEKSLFEAEMASDEELATAFRVYRTIETDMHQKEKYSQNESALQNSLQTLNTRYFKNEPQQGSKIFQLYPNKLYRITAAIAASILVIVVAYFVFFQPNQNTQSLANNYYKAHLQHLSQTMDDANDSLQSGIAAYNNQEYELALRYFKGFYLNHPDNSEAKKNAGLVYLATEEYDKALLEFEELAGMKNLYSNPGLFLQALTLMQRNQEGDPQKAKQLLQQVVNERAEGSKQAAEWLKQF